MPHATLETSFTEKVFAIYLKLKFNRAALFLFAKSGGSSPSFVGQRVFLALPISEHITLDLWNGYCHDFLCHRVIFLFQVVTIDDAHCFLSHLVLGLFFKYS